MRVLIRAGRVALQYSRPVLDEVRLWTVSRSQARIREAMHCGLDLAADLAPYPASDFPPLFVYLPLNYRDHERWDSGGIGQDQSYGLGYRSRD